MSKRNQQYIEHIQSNRLQTTVIYIKYEISTQIAMPINVII